MVGLSHTQTDIFSYNGGSLVGMRGKDCVALAADNRLG